MWEVEEKLEEWLKCVCMEEEGEDGDLLLGFLGLCYKLFFVFVWYYFLFCCVDMGCVGFWDVYEENFESILDEYV